MSCSNDLESDSYLLLSAGKRRTSMSIINPHGKEIFSVTTDFCGKPLGQTEDQDGESLLSQWARFLTGLFTFRTCKFIRALTDECAFAFIAASSTVLARI